MVEKEKKELVKKDSYEVKDVITQTERAITKEGEIITTQEAIARILNYVEEINAKLG